MITCFFMCFLKDNSSYKNLTKIIKIIVTLPHGNSEVERGFSINENALVDNMQMETIIAQRKVNDYVRKNNFQPDNMPMSKHCYKTPSKLTSGIKKRWTRSKSKRIRKALGLSK